MLRLSQVTIGKLSIGHIVNLVSNDVQRFDLVRIQSLFYDIILLYVVWCDFVNTALQAFIFLPYLVISPLHIIVVTYLIYSEVGWTVFLITGFIIFQVPLQLGLARLYAYFRQVELGSTVLWVLFTVALCSFTIT